jgi:hypothetical protein
MRKLMLLVGTAALAMTAGLGSVAHANHGAVVQETTGSISPSVLPATGYQNVNLNIVTSVRDAGDPAACSGASPPGGGTCKIPTKADHAYIDFDPNIRFNTNAAGRCSLASINGKTDAQARASCPQGIVGSGGATATAGDPGDPAGAYLTGIKVTAFNSLTPGVLFLHVDIGGLAFDLIGTLVNSPQPGFGERLDVPVIDTGSILTRFQTLINRPGYVQARCAPSPHDFRGLFTYADRGDEGGGVPIYPASAIGTSADPCTPTCAGNAATHVGTNGSDTITGTNGRDVVVAFGGNDAIFTGPGNDVVCAGFGHDRVFTRAGSDRIFGEQGADRAFGGGGRDVFFGQQGFDRFSGGGGADRAFGGGQLDRLFGGPGFDRLLGQAGHDRIFGNAGRDFLNGAAGRDRLFGGAARDRILGLGGRPDRCFGGAGRDRGGRGCERRRSIP